MKQYHLIVSKRARRITHPLLFAFILLWIGFGASLLLMFKKSPEATNEFKNINGQTLVENDGKTYELKTGPFGINPFHGRYLVEDHARIYEVQSKFFWAYFILLILSVGMGGVLIVFGICFHITGDMRYE